MDSSEGSKGAFFILLHKYLCFLMREHVMRVLCEDPEFRRTNFSELFGAAGSLELSYIECGPASGTAGGSRCRERFKPAQFGSNLRRSGLY